jgi:hypothetical protein
MPSKQPVPVEEPCEQEGNACQISQAKGINSANDQLGKLNALLSCLDLAALMAAMAEIKAAIKAVQTTVNAIQSTLDGFVKWMRLDRLLNIITFITTLHNAYMLSSALGQTLFSTIDSALGLFGIHLKDSEGKTISVSEMLGKTLSDIAQEMFGVQNWEGIKEEWKAFNRIYQAATNLLYAMQGLFYSVLAGMEVIGSWTASIGNALVKWRVIGHTAFGWMNTAPNFHNRLFTNLNNALMVVSQINFVVQSVQAVEGIVSQLTHQKDELEAGLKQGIPQAFTENKPTADAEKASQGLSTPPSINLDNLNNPP